MFHPTVSKTLDRVENHSTIGRSKATLLCNGRELSHSLNGHYVSLLLALPVTEGSWGPGALYISHPPPLGQGFAPPVTHTRIIQPTASGLRDVGLLLPPRRA